LCGNCADEARYNDSWNDYEEEMDFEYLTYP
jgi:hypothetical protein